MTRSARSRNDSDIVTERVGGFEIDDQLELCWLLDREFAWVRTPENSAG